MSARRRLSPRLWLHLLLCLVLLGNGVGAAMASGRIAVVEAGTAAATALTSTAAAAAADAPAEDCHGTAGLPAHHAGMAHAGLADTSDDHARHGEDCAQFCLDSCLQLTPAVVGPADAQLGAGLRAAPVIAHDPGLPATPRLPLLRPPIG